MTATIKYEFSSKYSSAHAQYYYAKHKQGIKRKFSNWLEQFMLSRALKKIGRQASILDFPCGTGRMWKTLVQFTDHLQVADNSRDMLETGLANHSPSITSKITATHHCSAFSSGLPDGLVDCVVSIRFIHHIQQSIDRIALLKEFARISARYVLVSLWVDGNFKAWRQLQKQRKNEDYMPRDRLLISQVQFEQEVADAGLKIVGYTDKVPGYDKWRTYILEV